MRFYKRKERSVIHWNNLWDIYEFMKKKCLKQKIKLSRQHLHSFPTLPPLCLRMHVNASEKGLRKTPQSSLATEYIPHINSPRTLDCGSFPKPSECLDTGRDSAMVC